MALPGLEQTIVAPALPTIGRTLGDVENLSWVVTAYLLANAVATPLFGKLSDIHGRRRMMLIAIVIFIVGSVACALAPNMPALIAARALQGIGGGGILPIAHTIIGDMVSPRERPRYQSYTSIMFMAASIIGPVVGGVLTDYVHWTMIFWINLPMGLLALWMTDRALKKLPRHDRPHKLDVLGALLMVLRGAGADAGDDAGAARAIRWASAPILGLLAGSAVLWLLFVLRVARAPEPFIPLSMLRAPIVGATAAAGFFSVGVIIGLTIYMPVYFELVLGFSPSGSGTALIVFLAAATVGSFIAGRLMVRLTHYKLVPVGGLAARHRHAHRRSPGSRAGCRSSRSACCSRSAARARRDVSGHHHDRAERGRAAPARHRDRRAQLRPAAGRRHHRRGVRHHRAGRHRHRRPRPDARDAARRGACRRRRFRAVVPLAVRGGGGVPRGWA